MKQPVAYIASIVVLIAIALGWYWSFRCLPPIEEKPPWKSERYGKNWFGHGGWAFVGYTAFLLLTVYSAKWLIVTYCVTRRAAAYWFGLLVGLSAPYIWFLCEPDWFNPFLYRVSCWVGGPIAIWFIPTVSFFIDLSHLGARPPLRHYLLRSGIEIVVIFPIWVILWGFFSFFVLEWGWI
jgi:hypothetical protein